MKELCQACWQLGAPCIISTRVKFTPIKTCKSAYSAESVILLARGKYFVKLAGAIFLMQLMRILLWYAYLTWYFYEQNLFRLWFLLGFVIKREKMGPIFKRLYVCHHASHGQYFCFRYNNKIYHKQVLVCLCVGNTSCASLSRTRPILFLLFTLKLILNDKLRLWLLHCFTLQNAESFIIIYQSLNFNWQL